MRIDGDVTGHLGNSAGYSAAALRAEFSAITAVVLTNRQAVSVVPVVSALLAAASLPAR